MVNDMASIIYVIVMLLFGVLHLLNSARLDELENEISELRSRYD